MPTTFRPAGSVELGARVAFKEPRIDRPEPPERVSEPLLAGLPCPPDHSTAIDSHDDRAGRPWIARFPR